MRADSRATRSPGLTLDRRRHPRGVAGTLTLALLALGGAPPGCSSGSTSVEPDAGDAAAMTGTTAMATLSVTVTSAGLPVADATIAAGGHSVDTDASGHAELMLPTIDEQAVRVSAPGFGAQVKVVTLPAGTSSAALVVTLISRAPAVSIPAIESGGGASGRHGVAVTFPAAALVDDSGQAVTGAVEMHMTPVDVAGTSRDAFPGAFQGLTSAGARAPIVSFGTAEFVPMQGGRRLNLAPGKTAEILLPLYVSKHQDGRAVAPGDEIPLWSLDEATGIWRQEGVGQVVAEDSSPTGLAFAATVRHFSWWNCDDVGREAMARVTVRVTDPMTAPGTTARLQARVLDEGGPASVADIIVPVNQPQTLRLASVGITRLEATIGLGQIACTGSTDVVASDGPGDVTIEAVCAPVPVPRIVSPWPNAITNSTHDLSFQIVLEGPMPDLVELLADGAVVDTSPAAFSYRLFWSSASAPEGLHLVSARATVGGQSRTSAPVQVVVDRTPPMLETITPAPGAAVATLPVFTLTFKEPVIAPLPQILREALLMASTPTGVSGPTALAPGDIIASTDASRTRITVRPRGPLPAGQVSLSWGTLMDAAENTVTGTISARFDVDPAVMPPPIMDPAGPGPLPPGGCMFGVRPTSAVAGVQIAQPLPAAIGGRIPSGYLLLAAHETYTGPGGTTGPTGRTHRASVAVVIERGGTAWREERSVDQDPPQKRVFAARSTGAQLTLAEQCPGKSSQTLEYSVEGHKVRFIDRATGVVQTFIPPGTTLTP